MVSPRDNFWVSANRSSEASKASTLDFTKGTASADERDSSSGRDSRKDLEQCPGSIVQEEDAFDGKKRAKEDSVRKRCRLDSRREMADIGAEVQPLEGGIQVSLRLHTRKTQGLTKPASIGKAPSTAAIKARVMTTGGL
jgi:hypothetical protein